MYLHSCKVLEGKCGGMDSSFLMVSNSNHSDLYTHVLDPGAGGAGGGRGGGGQI